MKTYTLKQKKSYYEWKLEFIQNRLNEIEMEIKAAQTWVKDAKKLAKKKGPR